MSAFFTRIIATMRSHGAKPLAIASAIITYAEDSDVRTGQRQRRRRKFTEPDEADSTMPGNNSLASPPMHAMIIPESG
nr:root phototropism protein 2 [Ipomoea batatas]